MRQLLYTVFITNNHVSFHLRWKELLLKYQKLSKYYDHVCLQNFLFLFLNLVTAPIVKSSHILANFFLPFWKNFLDQTQKSFITKCRPQWNEGKSR